jgi:hypothetical protein
MKILSIAALVLFAIAVDAKDEGSEITIHNDNIGNLVMSVPSEWRETQSTDDLSGASLMDVQSKKPKFQLRMEFSYFGLDGRRDDQDIDDYIGQRLDSYMQYQMEEFTENSVEGEFTSEVFGPGRHGRVARLTVRQRDRNDYLFITHGARIVDNAIVVFTLRSSDTDQAVLDQVVDVVSKVSMDNEIASFVGSYSCRTEHRVGFAGRNAVWIPDIADVVDQVFIVRTTSDGDQFADKTSWVFVEQGRIRATSWCDAAAVENGLFICHGANDEEFRMDTSTLRFLYSQMEGYYDVAEGAVLEKNQPTPFMDIGSCRRSER